MTETAAREATTLNVPVQLDAGDGAMIAAHVFTPDRVAAERLPRPTWIYAVHGANSSWRYFDMHVPEHDRDEYSFAAYMTSRGIGVVAVDALAMGESVFPLDPELLTMEVLAAAHGQAFDTSVRRWIADGADGAVQPAQNVLFCGLGHSGGGGVTIVTQALFRPFELIAVLGMPVGDFELPGGQEETVSAMHFDERGFFSMPTLTKAALKWSVGPEVPDDVIDAFHEAVPTPPCEMTMMQPGTLAPYARKIDTPIFLGYGEVDLARTPLSEPAQYSASRDVTLSIHPGCYHQHWAGPRRAEMWAALANWLWARAYYSA